MTEIKFRAWDKVAKTFVYFTVKLGEEVFLEPTDYEDTLYLCSNIEDKHKDDIYDGDYVRVTFRDGHTEDFTVCWVKHKARFNLVDKQGNWWNFTQDNDMEIIGNIKEGISK